VNTKSALFTAIVATVLLGNVGSFAQVQPSQPVKSQAKQVSETSDNSSVTDASSDQYLQLLRKDVRSLKKQIVAVAVNMDLTDSEAEKFWPIYDQYATEVARIYDSKLALIQEFSQNNDTMTGDQAEAYLRKRAAVEESIMQLRLKYISIFRKVLSGRETALFFQIDWRLGLMIDLQLAQAPLIAP
jgi:hypothetical protein